MLAETENEKSKWVVALGELHRFIKKNKLPDRMVKLFCIYISNDDLL